MKKIIFFLLIILISSNLIFQDIMKTYTYKTSNSELEFMAITSKGRGLEMMDAQFQNFKKSNP